MRQERVYECKKKKAKNGVLENDVKVAKIATYTLDSMEY